MFHYAVDRVDPKVRAAMECIAEDFPIRPVGRRGNVELRLDGTGCRIDGRVVSGGTLPELLRALALFRARRARPTTWRQVSSFHTLGLMVDVSRNAVPKVATIKYLLRRIALMGMNTLLLYMEDTYEVPGQPYIGYLRGRYTQAELRDIDQYAATLGVEVIPCIQTLAHLGQMLRWHVFDDVRDTSDILLADEPKTYRLIEQMIAAATKPFRSRRVHIGMDEAHGLGQGKYRQLHGDRPEFDIMTSHLKQVVDVTRKLKLRPMIWSDMYFRLGSRTGDYYDPNCHIPPAVAKAIPADVQLVLWDYYHADPADYAGSIERHRRLGKEPVFAGGLWTWNTFWHNHSKSRINTDGAMAACKAAGVKEAFTTAWFDDGAEADLLSMLPGVQHFAEHAYRKKVTDADLASGFLGSTGEDLQAWTTPAKLDVVPGLASMRDVSLHTPKPSQDTVARLERSPHVNLAMANPSKYLLWQDPLLGLFDVHAEGLDLAKHYASLCRDLGRQRQRSRALHDRLKLPQLLAAVLANKAEVGNKLRRLYRRRNRAGLMPLARVTLPQLRRDLQRLHEHHRRLWHQLHKPQGWEVLDGRYGSLAARLESTRQRLLDYLAGRIETLDELEEPRLPAINWPAGKLAAAEWPAGRMRSPSIIN